MDLADRCTSVGIVLIARREASAIQEIGKRSGRDDRLIFVTEAGKEIVGVSESMVDADIEIVLVELFFGIHQVVIAADVKAGKRRGKQGGDTSCDRVDGTGGEDVRGNSTGPYPNGHTTHGSARG